MSIVTGGWGSGAVSSAGWGSGVSGDIYMVPILSAVCNISSAYTWVITNDHVEVLSRDKGSSILERTKGEIINRSAGWNWEQ